MNLADLIEQLDQRYGNPHAKGCELIQEAITTLRQQQAEIEALQSENKFFKDLMGDVEILRKAQEK